MIFILNEIKDTNTSGWLLNKYTSVYSMRFLLKKCAFCYIKYIHLQVVFISFPRCFTNVMREVHERCTYSVTVCYRSSCRLSRLSPILEHWQSFCEALRELRFLISQEANKTLQQVNQPFENETGLLEALSDAKVCSFAIFHEPL